MTTLINYISGVVNFLATPNGITLPLGNNSNFASTTEFVKRYILDLVNLVSPPTIVARVNFASVRTSLLAGSIGSEVKLVIKGSTIALGKSLGNLTIMGNNVPITSTFKSTVVSLTDKSRIQAGKFRPTSLNATYTYPQSFTSTSVVIPTVIAGSNSIGVTVGTQSAGATTVSIRSVILGYDVNWVAFGN